MTRLDTCLFEVHVKRVARIGGLLEAIVLIVTLLHLESMGRGSTWIMMKRTGKNGIVAAEWS